MQAVQVHCHISTTVHSLKTPLHTMVVQYTMLWMIMTEALMSYIGITTTLTAGEITVAEEQMWFL